MTSPTPLTPQTMERLAFISLLHRQGDNQSSLPEPLSYACVLTYHDAIELFLMLAGEHLGAVIPERGRFVDRYFDNLDQRLSGTQMSGRKAVGRITDLRNAFKHANTWPGPNGIGQSRADTATFLEENCPKVFGMAYDAIDMADLIPQEKARELTKKAMDDWRAGDHKEAMALLRDAYAVLFSGKPWSERPKESPLAFGPRLRGAMGKKDAAAVLWQPDHSKRRGVPTRGAETLAEQITTVTESVAALQAGMQIVAIGIDYHEYHRFRLLTPGVFYSLAGTREPYEPDGYAPAQEDYDYCKNFVIKVALKLAEVEAHAAPPQWQHPPADA